MHFDLKANDLNSSNSTGPQQTLGLWDAISIIVGIVVGVSIFRVPSTVMQNVSSGWAALGVWASAGVLALVGALCYAELATRHRNGGEYTFLTRAFGRSFGFLFGWAQLTGVFSGSIGSMAYVFGDYGAATFGLEPSAVPLLALSSIAALTVLHVLGVETSKAVQNFLTVAKVCGLSLLLIVGLNGPGSDSLASTLDVNGPGVGLAWILILYAYGGWNDSAFVAAELKDPHRNIPRALGGGMLAIIVLYVLINLAYFRGLGFAGMRDSGTPAVDLMQQATLLPESWRGVSAKVVGVIVMISALGAVHGLLFTGSRLFAVMGTEHPLFAGLGRWHARLGTPVAALLAQASMTALLVVLVGTGAGRDLVDLIVVKIGRSPIPWRQYFGGFETLLAATAPVFWGFFVLNSIAVFVLRRRDAIEPAAFRVPLYPLTPLVFCATCLYMLWQSVVYAKDLSLLALLPLLIGIPLFVVSERLRKS